MTDSHCHLNHPDFAADLAQVIARAHAAGVERMVVVGYDLPSSRRAVELCAQWPGLAAAVGISPHDAGTWSSNALAELAALARAPGVVAIGEIGLDYHWRTHPPELQQQVFASQLELAVSLDLPVVVHNREADTDTMAILERHPAARALWHCFAGNLELGRAIAARGWRLGVAGNVTFRNAEALREVVAGLPPEAVVVETDSPYLAPVPHRGRRNEPAYLACVVQALARLWDRPPAQVAELTTATAAAFFALDR